MKMRTQIGILAVIFSCFAMTVLEAMDSGDHANYTFEQVLEMKPSQITKEIALKIKESLTAEQLGELGDHVPFVGAKINKMLGLTSSSSAPISPRAPSPAPAGQPAASSTSDVTPGEPDTPRLFPLLSGSQQSGANGGNDPSPDNGWKLPSNKAFLIGAGVLVAAVGAWAIAEGIIKHRQKEAEEREKIRWQKLAFVILQDGLEIVANRPGQAWNSSQNTISAGADWIKQSFASRAA